MFIKNKYSNWYFNIVDNAKSRDSSRIGYIEKHHIIPKSLGGSNDKTNMVSLTAKEHFICHLLLTKMVEGKDKTKMVYAAWRMLVPCRPNQERYKVSARIYARLKKERSDQLKTLVGPMSPNYGRKTGRTSADFTPEWRERISNSRKGKTSWNKGIPRSESVKEAVSKANKGRKTPGFSGRTHSDETKRKISEAFARKRTAL